MSSWDSSTQENHVLVKHQSHGSTLIKITPQISVSEVLKKVCEQWKLPPNKHALSYCTETLTDGDKPLSTCVPPNSTLHVIESTTIEDWSNSVAVSLQMNDTVFSKRFNKNDNLLQVVDELSKANTTFTDKDQLLKKTNQTNDDQKQNRNGQKSDFDKHLTSFDKDKPLLVQFPNGTVTLEPEDLKTTRLCDLSQSGLVFLAYLHDDVEDASPRDENDDDIRNKFVENDRSKSSVSGRLESRETESRPSVTKIKKIINDGWNKSNNLEQPFRIIQRPLELIELFDRYGLIFCQDGEKSSNKDYSVIDLFLQNDSSLHEIYTISWIRVCFPDGLVLQAAFSPSEYIQDIKEYVAKFLRNCDEEFNLYCDDKLLDEKQTIFSSGLKPDSKIYFVLSETKNEENQKEIDDNIHSILKSEQTIENGVKRTYLDPKYTKKIVTQSSAVATALKYKQTDTSITIETEIIRPKLDESLQDNNKNTKAKK